MGQHRCVSSSPHHSRRRDVIVVSLLPPRPCCVDSPPPRLVFFPSLSSSCVPPSPLLKSSFHPTSSCLWGWGRVVCCPSHDGALALIFSIVIPFGGISACFRGVSGDVAGYGVPRARTWQISSSRGLPVSPCALLVRIDNLTSRLNGEEGFALSLSGGGCTAVVPFVSCSLVPRNK